MHLSFFVWSSPDKDPGLQKCQDIFRRHPGRIFQWAENRSVPAEDNMSERGVRRTVIARKVCEGRTQSATGGGPSRLEKAGRSRRCLSDNGKILKADWGFGLDDSKSSDALLLRCSDAEYQNIYFPLESPNKRC